MYRVCPALFAESLLSMRGSILHGARFNIKGYFGTLYTSLNADTARREIGRYFTVPPAGGFLQASIELRLTRVLDLTHPNRLSQAGLDDNQLIEPRYSLTQEIGRHAWENGFEGLVTPSAAIPGERNLAVFLDNQRPKWRIGLSGFAEVRLT